jgi:hypothetical protein
MKNDHNKKTCWHCTNNHPFMTAKCAADTLGLNPKTIYNAVGRHFKEIRQGENNGSLFYHRAQVKAHFRVLLEKGECKGECALVFNQQVE